MADGFILNTTPMSRATRTPPKLSGDGYLAGEFPGGTTTIEGVPNSAEVTIRLRYPNSKFDGLMVATTVSRDDGTWRVAGLNPLLKYDVIGRKEGYNDVIVSNVQPVVE